MASRRMGFILHVIAEQRLNQGIAPCLHVEAYKITQKTQVIQ